MRAAVGFVRALAVLGVMTVSATAAECEQIWDGALYFAVSASAGVDAACAADIRAAYRQILQTQSGFRVIDTSEIGVAAVPGFAINVTGASAFRLDPVATWIDGHGLRRALFLTVLAGRPN